jgi:hypothetical protein
MPCCGKHFNTEHHYVTPMIWLRLLPGMAARGPTRGNSSALRLHYRQMAREDSVTEKLASDGGDRQQVATVLRQTVFRLSYGQ